MTCPRFHFSSLNMTCKDYQANSYNCISTVTHPCRGCPKYQVSLPNVKPKQLLTSNGLVGRPKKDKCPECGWPYDQWKEKKICKNPDCETGIAQVAENRRKALEYYHNHHTGPGRERGAYNLREARP